MRRSFFCCAGNSTTTSTEKPTTNSTPLPPGLESAGGEGGAAARGTSHGHAHTTQPIPTSRTPNVTSSATPSSQSASDSKSKSANLSHASPAPPIQSTHNKSASSLSGGGRQTPTKQSSLQTEPEVTQKVSHVNKMAEFYVSVSPAPRTTPTVRTNNNRGAKQVENTPSPSVVSVRDNDRSSAASSAAEVYPVEGNEDDNGQSLSADNSESDAQYPEQTDIDLSRSHKNRYGEPLETDDEDLLEGMGSGYYSSSRSPLQHRDRFAFEHDMGGVFAGSNNIYGQVEKVRTAFPSTTECLIVMFLH